MVLLPTRPIWFGRSRYKSLYPQQPTQKSSVAVPQMKEALSSSFWNQEVASTRSIDASICQVPAEPFPFSTQLVSGLNRSQQLLLFQRLFSGNLKFDLLRLCVISRPAYTCCLLPYSSFYTVLLC